ncbi:MAG: hypothetical protein CML73_02305 [Rhodobiaceae bacterium]|nr:hypothetical protein [Rhodobiaceae bacterium]
MSVQYTIEDLKLIGQQIGATSIEDVLSYLNGKSSMGQTIPMVGKTLNTATLGTMPKEVGRLAGSRMGRGFARAVPGMAAALNILGLADIVAGDDSLGNKIMDTALTTGATGLGAVFGGPLGASVGAAAGKSASDGLQALFGGGRSAEERKLEEALMMLNGGRG